MKFGFRIRIPSLSRKISSKTSLKRNLGVRKPTLLVNPEKALKRKITNATTLKLGYKKTTEKYGENPDNEKEETIIVECPKCQSDNVGKITTYIIVFLCVSILWFTISQSIFSFICLAVSISLIFMKKNYCRDCHYMFR